MHHKRLAHRSAVRLVALAVLAASAAPLATYADTSPGYVHDSDGKVVTTIYGECVHTLWWKPSMAVPGCDGYKEAAVVVPKPVEHVEPAPAPEPVAPAKPEKVTLDAKTLFNFDKATLRPDGRDKLDTLVAKLKRYPTVIDVQVVGYTDRIGSSAYNKRLSEKRAQTVADYLRSRTDVKRTKYEVLGKGKADPVVECHNTGSAKALIKCLQPNRRVEVNITAETDPGAQQ